jgi:hypothetical protein
MAIDCMGYEQYAAKVLNQTSIITEDKLHSHSL